MYFHSKKVCCSTLILMVDMEVFPFVKIIFLLSDTILFNFITLINDHFLFYFMNRVNSSIVIIETLLE